MSQESSNGLLRNNGSSKRTLEGGANSLRLRARKSQTDSWANATWDAEALLDMAGRSETAACSLKQDGSSRPTSPKNNLLENFSEIEDLLRQLKSTSFVGIVDEKYHMEYIQSSPLLRRGGSGTD